MPDEIYIKIQNGKTHLEEIEGYLRNIPFCFQDPVFPYIYLLCGSKESMKFRLEQRLAARNAKGVSRPYECFVALRAELLTVDLLGDEDSAASCKSFLKWLLDHYSFEEITDDYGNNLTQMFKKDKDKSLERVFE